MLRIVAPPLRFARLLLAMTAFGALGAPVVAGDPWRVGQPLPDVRLPSIDGGAEVALSSFRGRRLLLIEFASW